MDESAIVLITDADGVITYADRRMCEISGYSQEELIGQTQLPPGSRVVHEQSLILGAGDNWVGRLALDVGRDTSASYNFFLDQYQRNGWSLISASRGKTSLLVFTKPDRSATIEISEGGALSGPNLVMTITPRSANTPPVARPPAASVPPTTAVPNPVRP